jgi:transcriptional regulator with XRE-family HTH domain
MARKATELNRIKQVLQEKGITQAWLAQELDMDAISINRYCSNRQQPSIAKLALIAKVLKVSPRDLLRG